VTFADVASAPELNVFAWQSSRPVYLQFTQLPQRGSLVVREAQQVRSWRELEASSEPVAFAYTASSLLVKLSPQEGSPQKDERLAPWAQGYMLAQVCYSTAPLPAARVGVPPEPLPL
jgi:hypothetical protein